MFKPATSAGYQPKYTSSNGDYWYKEYLRGGEGFIIL